MGGRITLVLYWALPLAILFLALPFFVLDTHLAWYSFPLDDAWIHRVYSESLAEGRGFAYNDEQEAGFTSPLWALITAPAHWFSPQWGVPIVKLAGALLAVVIAACATCLGTKISGSRVVGLVVGCLLMIDPRGLFVIFSGMESGLLLVLWLGAILALVRENTMCR